MKDHKCRSDVQTLSHQLEAARHNIDYLQEHLLHQSQQSSEFQINLSETQQLADQRERAHWDRQVLRLKIENEKKNSGDRWRDAAS